MTNTQNSKTVVVLIYEQLCMFEFSCVAEVFGLPRPEMGNNWYQFKTASIDGNPVNTQYHGQISPDISLSALEQADLIIIPGWSGIDDDVPAEVIDKLCQLHAAGTRLASICSGVKVLASTGLLNKKSATTHWRYIDTLKKKHPEIDVKTDVLYIDHESLLTSAGSAAGLDLCLHIVRKDFGSDIANQVARRLVIPPLREGSQAQFVQQPVPSNDRGVISPVLDLMHSQLDQPHPTAKLAATMNLSERTFLRRFKEATGTTPGEWLSEARVQRAKTLLESTDLSVERVATQVGFGTAMTLRHHFRKRLHISPVSYRKQFSTQDMGVTQRRM